MEAPKCPVCKSKMNIETFYSRRFRNNAELVWEFSCPYCKLVKINFDKRYFNDDLDSAITYFNLLVAYAEQARKENE